MARQEKQSRAKGLPARIRADEVSFHTGSFPTKFRTSCDNRTGNYNTQFNDELTLDYHVTSSNVVYPLVVTSGTKVYNDLANKEPDLFSGSISYKIKTSGSMKRGISDNFITFTDGQVIQPFKDNSDPVSDGTISSSTRTPNPFYQTGSVIVDAGPGFQQPLTAKTKIEIDISIGSDVVFGHRSGSGSDYLMVYYDHSNKTYNTVGSGLRMDQDFPLLGSYYTGKAIGFAGTSEAWDVSLSKVAGATIDTFGFPHDPRYFVSSSSPMLYHLSGVLSEPFLLEKVVVEFSASLENMEFKTGEFLGPAYSTFFILNQKGGRTIKPEAPGYFPAGGVSGFPNSVAGLISIEDGVGAVAQYRVNAPAPPGFGIYLVENAQTHNSGVMDIVTVMQFGTASTGDGSLAASRQRELMFGSGSTIYNGYTTGFSVMSGTVKTPTKNSAFSSYILMPSNYYSDLFSAWWTRNNYGGRTGLPNGCARSWKKQMPTEERTSGGLVFLAQQIWENNPYILMPTDKLIIGWQSPLILNQAVAPWSSSYGAKMTLAAGTYKLKLYGSNIVANDEGVENPYKENHDNLNQLLSSEVVHEVIG